MAIYFEEEIDERDMCRLINRKNNVFEKSLLALVLLSYIQAFNDGNKRTARIVSKSRKSVRFNM
jgi:Fic family protein